MSAFEDYVRRLDERAAHIPRSAPADRERKVTSAIGTAAGSSIQGDTQVMSSFLPIVQRTFERMRRGDKVNPRDIEEYLLDSLRLTILFVDQHGDQRGTRKSKMPIGEFLALTKRRHDRWANNDLAPEVDPSNTADLDDLQ